MNLSKTYGVYKITCTGNGMFYIGSTINCFSNRFAKHKEKLEKGKHENLKLMNSYREHGFNSFVFEVLFDMTEQAKELIRLKEKELVDELLDSGLCCNENNFCGVKNDKDNLRYNLSNKEITYSAEPKAVHNNIGEIFHSINTAARYYKRNSVSLRQHLTGKSKSFAGLYWAHVGQDIKILGTPRNFTGSLKIYNSNGDVFDSMTLASRSLNIPVCNISSCIAGRQKTAGGLQWFKVED